MNKGPGGAPNLARKLLAELRRMPDATPGESLAEFRRRLQGDFAISPRIGGEAQMTSSNRPLIIFIASHSALEVVAIIVVTIVTAEFLVVGRN